MEAFEDFIYNARRFYREKIRVIWRRPMLFFKNIWRFRKQMWNFGAFDYSYNVDLFKRSLEITRDFMRSDKAVAANAFETAEEIQTFLNLLEKYDNSFEMASRYCKMGDGDSFLLWKSWDQMTEEEKINSHNFTNVLDQMEKEN